MSSPDRRLERKRDKLRALGIPALAVSWAPAPWYARLWGKVRKYGKARSG
jgi:hypothetical protein